jgi:hypothetical protein
MLANANAVKARVAFFCLIVTAGLLIAAINQLANVNWSKR